MKFAFLRGGGYSREQEEVAESRAAEPSSIFEQELITTEMKMSVLVLLVGLSLAGGVAAREKDRLPGPLLQGLGSLQHPVSTESGLAQRYFNQGLTLSFAFNHREAVRAFRSAAKLDENLAMAWWGVAYASGPHVNKAITPEENEQAWKAVQKAQELRSKASPKEQAFIDAIAARYAKEYREDRVELDRAYAQAMRELVAKYPDDLDAQVLLAEAIMDTMPWDYWTKDRTPKPETEEVLRALRLVTQRDPHHPGANHLYIHAVEAGPAPETGQAAADRLLNYAPAAGHLVHMPAHIYIRVGQYREAIVANERAVTADQNYIKQCKAQGFYPGAYYPHNIHFLWWAQLFEGQSEQALRTAYKTAKYAADNACGPNKAVEAPRFRHLPGLTLARFGRWDAVLQLPKPDSDNDFLVDRVIWHYLRGLAFAAKGDGTKAQEELQELTKRVESNEAKKLDGPAFPVSAVFELVRTSLAGKVDWALGRQAEAIKQFEKAVALEDAMPYMEPAFWPIAVRPTLGAALLQAGEAAKAEQVFRDDLAKTPRNGWGLYGLEKALRAQNKTESAELIAREFKRSWRNADTQLDLGWF